MNSPHLNSSAEPLGASVDAEADSSSTADRLEQIALELFASWGYSGTSLADIAGRLGIRKPSLYNYYRSKDELFFDLFAKSLDRWREISRPPLQAAGSCAERLQQHLHDLVRFAAGDPHTTSLCRVAVSQISGDLAARVEDLLEQHRRDYQDQLREVFQQGIDAGELPQRPLRVLVLSWSVFVDGILTRQVFLPQQSQETVDHLDELWQLYWTGVSTAETTP